MTQGISLFNQTIIDYLVKNKRYLLTRPAYIKTFSRIWANIKKQTKVRDTYAKKEGLIVPPVLIISVTNDCNLNCKGCYACNQQRNKLDELSIEDISRTVHEAVSLGVSIILIAGGEPLMKQGILDIPKQHPNTLFVMFTNGLLLSGSALKNITAMKNLIPVISVEGNKASTDARRGKGMFDTVMQTIQRLDSHRSLFGASITVTSENYREVMDTEYLDHLESLGCRAVFLIEYVPTSNDFHLCLTPAQKEDLCNTSDALCDKHDMLIVPLPGDEDKYGGCLASGRGFLHISSTGALEACPFAPYSDTNIKNVPLKEALKSRLLYEIRNNHHQLRESRGGCALQENQEWINTLL